ncbi:hypothetical protein GO009_15495 [Muricauda sp. TY007]|uniref:hypothetical protein n=1 Tax=Allomuricauda sp. TY007 TaxID=2683200 RepID=UPI0013C26BA0|nr:hypothetical protein [Muricauda sp. TY007]NDV17428.1 hypothetical protein [Muricauda sp. TY007]
MQRIQLRKKPAFIIEVHDDSFRIEDKSDRKQRRTFYISDISSIYYKKEEINTASSMLTMGISLFLPSGLGFGKVIKEVPRICMVVKNEFKEILLDNCEERKVKESLALIKSKLEIKSTMP